ncbi:hypothetical protein AAG906_000869 [Vitis piasezkii]
MAGVKLLGFWASPFSHRVIWALKLKGVSYEYIEEDLSNKSQLLIQNNPVHKQIPVLIHGDKAVAESLVILEYIDETWPHNPLLPKGAYERATARFWIKFAVEKGATFYPFYNSNTGEEQEKATKETVEVLKIIEEEALGDEKFFGGEDIGLLDLVLGWFAHWFDIIEELVGVKVLDASKLPRLHAWTENFKEVPVIKENLRDRSKLLAYFKHKYFAHLPSLDN